MSEHRRDMNIAEKLNNTFTKELKRELKYTLLNQTKNVRESL